VAFKSATGGCGKKIQGLSGGKIAKGFLTFDSDELPLLGRKPI